MATAANPIGTRAKDNAAVVMPPSVGTPPPPADPAVTEPPGVFPFSWKFKVGNIIAIPTIPGPNVPNVAPAVSRIALSATE